jgi:hypothetical protein
MALSTPIQYPCTRCGQPVDAVLHRSFVIEDEASLAAIVEQRFHVLECGGCGETRAFEADFLVTNGPRDLFVQVITRDDQVAGMIDTMREMLQGPGVHARIVASRNDLVEKVKLWKAGLDDVAMEVAKHFLRIQLKDLDGKTSRFFERVEGDELLFAVLIPGEPVRGMKLPLQVYENIRRELRTATYASELEVDERIARRLLEQRAAAQNKG